MMNPNDRTCEGLVQLQDEETQSMLQIKLKIQQKWNSLNKEAFKTYLKSFIQDFMSKVDIILISLLIIWFTAFLATSIKQQIPQKCPLLLQQVTNGQSSTIQNQVEERSSAVSERRNENVLRDIDEGQNQERIDSKNATLNILLKLLKDQDVEDQWQEKEPMSYSQQDEENAQGNIFKISTSPFDPQIKKIIKQKKEKHLQRTQSFGKWQAMPKFQNLKHANYNFQMQYSNMLRGQDIQKQERDKMEQKYAISEFTKELSICTIIYANANSKKQYSHQYVLHSLLRQDYQRHRMVYIADGHQRQQMAQIRNFIQQNSLSHNIYLIWNQQRRYMIQSILMGIKAHCLNSDVISLMRATDELLGKFVYKTINSMYLKYDSKIVYSNSIKYHQKLDRMESGPSEPYENDEKIHNKYRKTYKKYGNLFTFWTKLAAFIKEDDLKDANGYFYQQAGEDALIYSLLQLSCGQVFYLPEYNYLEYDEETDEKSVKLRRDNIEGIKNKASYSCYKKYE